MSPLSETSIQIGKITDLYKRYPEFIEEFFHLGHMQKAPTSELIKLVEN